MFSFLFFGSNEGNVTHNWEVGENREGLGQENDCLKIHKYDDNLYEQSPSSLISVFGRPLLPGGIFGLRGVSMGMRTWNHYGWWRLTTGYGEWIFQAR